MKRIALSGLLLLATIAAAHALGLGLGNRFGKLGAAGIAGVAAPLPTGAILRIDGTSNILRIDGTSLICRAGGGC